MPGKSAFALNLIRDLARSGGKVVCWSNFIANLDDFSALVRREVPEAKCFQVDGRIPTGDESTEDVPDAAPTEESPTRDEIIDRFLACRPPAVLVTNPASCSESISLHTSCHNAIYLDRTFDCAQFLQSIDRVHRLGLPAHVKVNIHILVATVSGGPTVDAVVAQSLSEKELRMRQLLEGAELRGLGLAENPAEDADGDAHDLEVLLRYLVGETERAHD